MKNFLFYFFCFFLTLSLFGQSIRLNDAGRIVDTEKTLVSPEYKFVNNNFVIEFENKIFEGNGFYKTYDGFLTIESYEEAVPVVLRFYNSTGELINQTSLRRIYNIKFSPDRNYIIFFDAKDLIVLNTSDFSLKSFPSSPVFAVDNKGIPIYYDDNMKQINYGNFIISFEEHPIDFLFAQENIYIFTRKNIYQFDKNNLKLLYSFGGTFYEATVLENNLYAVEKIRNEENFFFKLLQLNKKNEINQIEEKIIERNLSTRHEEIPSPLKYGEVFPHPVGNSYGEIQDYGGSPYLHPGVDIMGAHFENVFAVKDGVVKAILTTSGSLHWRIAIANEQTADSSEGYLYAHLVQESIPFAIGDTVEAGEVVGTLVPWPVADFTHIHFARIKAAGTVWSGAWWTINNPHIDIPDMIDTTPPVFENAFGNNLFAFRDSNGIYQQVEQVRGNVQIISKVHDISNSIWKIDVNELSYKLFEEGAPSYAVIDKVSFAYDFKLDTYFSSNYEGMILSTIYSRDATCFSIGNYNERNFYQIISNTSGTRDINPDDKNRLLNTRLLPNGVYSIEVTAKDAIMNSSTVSMEFIIDNPAPAIPQLSLPANNSVGLPVMLDLQWLTSPNSEAYIIQVAKDELFETIFITESGITSNNFTLDSLSPGTTYYWRVSAKGNSGCSPFSNSWSFTTTGSVNTDETNNVIPAEYVLYQNYPNPFNPSTIINYSIPAAGKVEIKIYDIIGNEISTLLNEFKQPGNYKINFNSNIIPSGVYFYQIKAGNFSDTKKMLLIR